MTVPELDPSQLANRSKLIRPPVGGGIFRHLMAGGSWSFGARIVNIAANLVFSMLLARMLSPAQFGAFTLSYWLVLAFGNFCPLGGNQIAVRSLARSLLHGDIEDLGHLVMNMLVLIVAGSLVCGLVVATFAQTIAGKIGIPGDFILLPIFWTWCISYGGQLLLGEIFRGVGAIDLASIFSGALGNLLFTTSVALLFVLHISTSLEGVYVLAASCSLLAIFGGVTALLRRPEASKLGRPRFMINFLRQAMPLLVMFFGGFVTNQVDLWMISIAYDHKQVAVYGVASRLAVLAGMPKLIMEGSLPPLLAKAHLESNKNEQRDLLQFSSVMTTIPAALYLVALTLIGAPVLRLIYGNPYGAAAPLLLVLAAGQVFYTATGSATITLVMAYRQKDVLIVLVGGGFASALLTYFASVYGTPMLVAFACTAGIILQNCALIAITKIRTGVYPNITPRAAIAVFRRGVALFYS